MADYDILPATLAALYTVKDKPQGTEPVSTVDDYLRQTRNWMYDFLSIYIDPSTGKIKSSAFSTDGSLPPGVVRGTNPVGNIQREILQGSILGADIADATVTGAKIGTGTITNTNIADNTIQGGKLADASVTSAKIAASVFTTANIADLAITNAKVATGTLTGDKLADNAIISAKMADRSAVDDTLPLALAGQILVGGNGTEGKTLVPKTMSGVVVIDKDGITRLAASIFGNFLTYCRVVEKSQNNTHAGGSTAQTWHKRGSGSGTPPWSIENPTRDFIELGSNGVIYFKEGGKYLLQGSAPAFNVNGHKTLLIFVPNPAIPTNETIRGFIGTEEDGAAAVSTRSYFEALVDVTVSDSLVQSRPYLVLYHWTESTKATDGLGRGHNVTGAVPSPYGTLTVFEVFADIHILKVQDDVPTA